MSVLAKSEILKRVQEGSIRIEPFDESLVGPASIDLRVDNVFYDFDDSIELFRIHDESDYFGTLKELRVPDGKYFLLKPGRAALGRTIERVQLPDDICAWIGGRSRYARLGLLVHITASFIHPGVENRQVLEFYNASSIPMAIYPGTRLCQLIFQETLGSGRYSGMFSQQ